MPHEPALQRYAHSPFPHMSASCLPREECIPAASGLLGRFCSDQSPGSGAAVVSALALTFVSAGQAVDLAGGDRDVRGQSRLEEACSDTSATHFGWAQVIPSANLHIFVSTSQCFPERFYSHLI